MNLVVGGVIDRVGTLINHHLVQMHVWLLLLGGLDLDPANRWTRLSLAQLLLQLERELLLTKAGRGLLWGILVVRN